MPDPENTMPDGSYQLVPEGRQENEDSPSERGTSTIAFPYAGLADAVDIARTIWEQGGVGLSRPQIEAALRANHKEGNLSAKLGAARIFGLLAAAGGQYALTDLGHQVLSTDESTAKAGYRDAFLKAPLYRRLYDEFYGRSLPPSPEGLERTFAAFGVAPKQTAKARWAFENSARVAGFFHAGRDRLVEPIIKPTTRAGAILRDLAMATSPAAPEDMARHPGDATKDPLIAGLLMRLPKAGEIWDYEKRARWLQLLAANLDAVYEAEQDSGKTIKVTIETERRGE